MMKKMMILALVVGMASLASAGYEWGVGGTETPLDIDVFPGILSMNSDAGTKAYDISLIFDGVTYDASAVTYGGTWDFPAAAVVATDTEFRFSAAQFFGGAQFGLLMDGLTFDGKGTIQIVDQLGGGEVLGTLNVIPEPMTLGLLGLGGLFLRRRK